jgi:hypothetical protein
LKVCLLSKEETGRLRHYGIFPDCRQHRHIPAWEAEQGLRECTHVTVDPRLLTAVTLSTSEAYVWRNRPSGGPQGAKVRQLVAL